MTFRFPNGMSSSSWPGSSLDPLRSPLDKPFVLLWRCFKQTLLNFVTTPSTPTWCPAVPSYKAVLRTSQNGFAKSGACVAGSFGRMALWLRTGMRALRPSRPIGNLSSQTCVGPSLPSHNGKLLCSMVFLLLSKPLTSLSPLVLRCKLLRIAAQDSHGAAGHDTWTAQELKYLPLDVFNTVSELLRAFATARDVSRSSLRQSRMVCLPKDGKIRDYSIKAGDARPISVMSVWWRLWNSSVCRSTSLRTWLCSVLLANVGGGVSREDIYENTIEIFDHFHKHGFMLTIWTIARPLTVSTATFLAVCFVLMDGLLTLFIYWKQLGVSKSDLCNGTIIPMQAPWMRVWFSLRVTLGGRCELVTSPKTTSPLRPILMTVLVLRETQPNFMRSTLHGHSGVL